MSETIVNCPTCEQKVIWNKESLFRPFCSHRCKLIDLGEWASDSRRIPTQEQDVLSEELEKAFLQAE